MSSSAQGRVLPASDIWTVAETQGGSRTTPARTEDAALMARVQVGEEAALEMLLERHGRLVLNLGLRVLRDPGEAQELVQDAFLQVYRKSQLFDPKKGSFRAWLIRLASNRAFDRREYLNLHRFYDDRNLDDFTEVIQSAVDVEYQAQVSQGEATLRKVFAQLNPKQRRTLELYFFEGYTLREISEHLNESLPNTRHYYYRGLEKLRESLGTQNGD